MPPPRKPNAPPGNAPGADPKGENVYIPSFISKRPFYAGEESESTDYLEHQRLQKKDDEKKDEWYARGRRAGPAATKYRKGACVNCGAMTHAAKDCLSRPRARGAKWTGKDIEADEVVQDVNLGWDAKRDRWNGFDAREYMAVVDEFNEIDELRKKALEKQKGAAGGAAGDTYAEELDPTKHQSTATRQLRIREDTAKYLMNLDLNSATYNPKTRALVNAGEADDKTAQVFAEEGFMKASGDAAEFERAQQFAWEAQERKGDTSLHVQANPTAGAFYRKKEEEEAEKRRAERERLLREKYGGGDEEEGGNGAAKALRAAAVTESEMFVEYDESGAIKGLPKTAAKSKYVEDVHPGNHTSVWGSWWADFKWGYACCRSVIKNSYCTGEAGVEAFENAERQRTGAGLLTENGEDGEGRGDGDNGEQQGGEERKMLEPPARKAKKRVAKEMTDGITEEELDEYRRKRTAADDPMAKLLGKDELVH
ncbi:related to step II splicing factor SLU7 [Cephalotrichum gorgonifer]|uniref:Pre-mRNA-splicing factor SLU7 n=1 Tax=Cephalotrichum gorgonifer TaxID=2041049 RepID=A0AAE8N079_9PEZI|nr:related to step II splicing factor SLU7 [Cephalotrichum gorgonifer]